jgi:hypothetical protein
MVPSPIRNTWAPRSSSTFRPSGGSHMPPRACRFWARRPAPSVPGRGLGQMSAATSQGSSLSAAVLPHCQGGPRRSRLSCKPVACPDLARLTVVPRYVPSMTGHPGTDLARPALLPITRHRGQHGLERGQQQRRQVDPPPPTVLATLNRQPSPGRAPVPPGQRTLAVRQARPHVGSPGYTRDPVADLRAGTRPRSPQRLSPLRPPCDRDNRSHQPLRSMLYVARPRGRHAMRRPARSPSHKPCRCRRDRDPRAHVPVSVKSRTPPGAITSNNTPRRPPLDKKRHGMSVNVAVRR